MNEKLSCDVCGKEIVKCICPPCPFCKTCNDRFGYVCLQSWSGVTRQRVQIVAETPKKYRIKAIEFTKLAGRSRWIKAGEEALVPKYAVLLEGSPSETVQNDGTGWLGPNHPGNNDRT